MRVPGRRGSLAQRKKGARRLPQGLRRPPSEGNTGRLNFIALSCMNRNRYEAEPGYGETRYDANRARLKRQPKKTKQAKGKL